MALEKKYYSGAQVFDIIKELPGKEFLSMLNTFAKERGADVVEVVRCKDCKWMDEYLCCTKFNVVIATRSTFFCAIGERRDDGKVH